MERRLKNRLARVTGAVLAEGRQGAWADVFSTVSVETHGRPGGRGCLSWVFQYCSQVEGGWMRDVPELAA